MPLSQSKQSLVQQFWASPDDALVSREAVAAVLNYTPRWLHSLGVAGDGPPFIRLPGRCLYRKRAVLAWLEHFEKTSEGVTE